MKSSLEKYWTDRQTDRLLSFERGQMSIWTRKKYFSAPFGIE